MESLAHNFWIRNYNEELVAKSKGSVDIPMLSHCMTVHTAKPWLKDNG